MPTEAPVLLDFFRGMRGTIHVTFEEARRAQCLRDVLVHVVDRVLVCDRRGRFRRTGIRAMTSMRMSCAELFRRGALRAVYHGTPERATLKELARTNPNLVEGSTRVMLRLNRCSAPVPSRRPVEGSTALSDGRNGSHNSANAARGFGPRRCP